MHSFNTLMHPGNQASKQASEGASASDPIARMRRVVGLAGVQTYCRVRRGDAEQTECSAAEICALGRACVRARLREGDIGLGWEGRGGVRGVGLRTGRRRISNEEERKEGEETGMAELGGAGRDRRRGG